MIGRFKRDKGQKAERKGKRDCKDKIKKGKGGFSPTLGNRMTWEVS